jgi:cytochrome c553
MLHYSPATQRITGSAIAERPHRRYRRTRRITTLTRACCALALLEMMSMPWRTRAAEPSVTAPATAPAHMEACVSCHGALGRSSAPDIPHLAGQQVRYLVKQLEAFRGGERKNSLMQAIAGQLTDQDIQALARYWSHLPSDGGATMAKPGAVPVPSGMRFPDNFPAGFVEYDRKSDEKSQVVMVRYVNQVAADAVRAGRPLPFGTVLLNGTYAALLGADGRAETDAQGRFKPGTMRSIAGMESRQGWGDPVPPLLRNGDWHYGLWGPDGQSRLDDMHARCLACHKPQAAQDFVFTWAALRRALSGTR